MCKKYCSSKSKIDVWFLVFIIVVILISIVTVTGCSSRGSWPEHREIQYQRGTINQR